MRIGLFVPCYIDAFFPAVGIATLELLERFGHEVVYPRDQTCCGQPMANSGFNAECAATEALFVRNFSGFDYIVAPSGSCVHHVRDNFDAIEQSPEVTAVRGRTYEIVEFLHDILKVDAFPWARFPHRVGLHNSCGTLRRLKHAKPSELHEPFFSKPLDLLSKVADILIIDPTFNARKYSNLPFASSLNGSCTNVCPVKINIHEQIYAWRRELVKRHEVPLAKKAAMKAAGELLSHPAAYRAAIAVADAALAHLPRFVIYNGLNAWGKHREVPHPPKQTFHSWYQANRGGES